MTQTAMVRLLGTGRMNRSGNAGTLTVPADFADRFDIDADGVDVVYLDTDDGVLIKAADEVELA